VGEEILIEAQVKQLIEVVSQLKQEESQPEIKI